MQVPIPYSGKEKYIFISYSHRDTYQAFEIITRLQKNGYRVWFDGGIDPGTEWDENIALHINDCGYFIALMSNNYLNSNNCKDELNYARDLEKERLIVYLEDVTLPAGLAMRVNRLQSIFKFTYGNEEDFYKKLFTAKNIEICKDQQVKAQQQTPPPVQQARPQTPPPVQQARPQTPPPVQQARPQWQPGGMPVQNKKQTQKVNAPRYASIGALVLLLIAFSQTGYEEVVPLLVLSLGCGIYAIYAEKSRGWRIASCIIYYFDAVAFAGFLLSEYYFESSLVVVVVAIAIGVHIWILNLKKKKANTH